MYVEAVIDQASKPDICRYNVYGAAKTGLVRFQNPGLMEEKGFVQPLFMFIM